jgi:ABC-type lipoprotein export system ATPase subunit
MTLLELRGIGMEYGAIRALAEVDYALSPGEIVGLIGDNGAGKSTLVKIIAGNFPPTHGTMHFDGRQVRFRGPPDARNAGIEVVYQDLALADNLSGAANVFLGRELRRRVAGLGIMDHAAMTRRAAQLLAELKSETRPEALVRTLSGGQRQAVAIARTRLRRGEARAARRAHGVDLGASGGRGPRPDAPHARPRAVRDLHQPRHAAHLRRRRPDNRAAPRPESGRQADGCHLARGSDGADHRCRRAGLMAGTLEPPALWPMRLRPSWRRRGMPQTQTAYVAIALAALIVVISILAPVFITPRNLINI